MNITKETKLKDLLTEYPWLKEEIVKVNDCCSEDIRSRENER